MTSVFAIVQEKLRVNSSPTRPPRRAFLEWNVVLGWSRFLAARLAGGDSRRGACHRTASRNFGAPFPGLAGTQKPDVFRRHQNFGPLLVGLFVVPGVEPQAALDEDGASFRPVLTDV